MFKKLKDKLAEEVKSSPQRIQQFAQAAQAAVTSASSSISDITNNDLFSIGDNDLHKVDSSSEKLNQATVQKSAFQEVSLIAHNTSATEPADYRSISELPSDSQRQRRLSNSSFTSDVSFKLPSYDSPSMYHLQSDMEVSASEAEERGMASPGSGLERVTKEQLYAAYTRTQQRYAKYRSQYADLARHYKLLERENAKAKSVLVETQDKALRRISELREQCSLEQSAKAHLERALRMDIDEKNLKIETLTTKVQLLQSGIKIEDVPPPDQTQSNLPTENSAQLIDLSGDGNDNQISKDNESNDTELSTLNNKIEKMELLINKYKESLKAMKEKNSQLTTEIQLLSNDVEAKTKENERLQLATTHLVEARKLIQDLKDQNEELQNKINTYDFSKSKETSTLENEISELKKKNAFFTKREEDYAISLAENKLSIHKELESKESEIKSLKNSLSISTQEVQALNKVVNDYKKSILSLEAENSKINNELNELNIIKNKLLEKDNSIKELTDKCYTLEHSKTTWDEEYKCLELQVKQETAEKLAMIDRNTYLENKNKLILEENSKKSAQLSILENELLEIKRQKGSNEEQILQEQNKQLTEINVWKGKCQNLEFEIQEERVELVKLQTEIEKLLSNYDAVQLENTKLNSLVSKLKTENAGLEKDFINNNKIMIIKSRELFNKISEMRAFVLKIREEVQLFKSFNVQLNECKIDIKRLLSNLHYKDEVQYSTVDYDNMKANYADLQENAKNVKERYAEALKEIITLKDETELLQNTVTEVEDEHKKLSSSYSELQDTVKKYEIKLMEMNNLESQKQNLIKKVEEYEREFAESQTLLKQNTDLYDLKLKDIETLIKEKEILLLEIENLQQSSNEKFDKMQVNLQVKDNELSDIKVQNELFNNKIKELLEENTSLKNNLETFVINFKTLENELADVRKSHSEIVDEKDRLSSTIEKFEQSELHKIKYVGTNKETQINENSVDLIEKLKLTIEENNVLKTKCEQVKQEKEEFYEKLRSIEQANERSIDDKQKYIDECLLLRKELLESQNKYQTVESEISYLKEVNTELTEKISNHKFNENTDKNDYDLLKEENRRLLSDIEGLQTYLSKISKENGSLNDKLREMIASSGLNESENNMASIEDITKLKNELQMEKEKSDDLIRQNTLLSEENLELKDQLQTQSYVPLEIAKRDTSEQLIKIEKYNELFKSKNDLENKLSEAQHANCNLRHLQENNQKLRLTNEKLERRLDEALVSLRHLHSLQENTELEYLRNVLYEYLTGTGAHSETLAKVLAAVVKFDDKQTQFVLQKEKERQGLLRQLGLL